MSDDASNRTPESASMETLIVERERHNEHKYRKMYTELLQKYSGILEKKETENVEDFREESLLLKDAVTSERQAWLSGAAVGLIIFTSLRFLPKIMIRRFGGEAKVKALREAEEKSKADRTHLLQRATGMFIEGSFSAWAGYRGYQLASQQSEGTYELIAQVPLVAGRSVVAENICDEWIHLTTKQIPPAFWKNLKDGELKDERTWNAIRSFARNCLKRNAYEEALKRELGITDRNKPVSLPRRVPDNMNKLLFEGVGTLTRQEARQLVTDDKVK